MDLVSGKLLSGNSRSSLRRFAIVFCRNGSNNKVEREIKKSFPSYEVINPVTPVEVFPRNRKSKKPVIVNKTSFPGYIFVDLKGQSWRELKPIKNVFGVLVRDSEPFLLRKEQISEIVLAPEKKVDVVKIGDKVTFKSGPFQNIPATYQSKGKINIFVFGSSRLMVVDPSLLVKFEELKK